MKYNKIILLGFRCTGKSHIGKILSKKIGWEAIDMDSEMQRRENKTAAEIANHGKDWTKFRILETEVLQDLLQKENLIISAGGGVGVNFIKNPENSKTFGEIQAEILHNNKSTLKVLLTAKEETIKQRLIETETKYKGSRPALDSKTVEDSNKSVERMVKHNLDMLKRRKEYYKNLADIIIETDSSDININKIKKVLQNG